MLISVGTITVYAEIFAHSISVHMKYHPGALIALCSAALYHTITVTGSIPQLRPSITGTLLYIPHCVV
jgi:hypothetical protein